MGSQTIQPAAPVARAATPAVVPSSPPQPALADRPTRTQRPSQSSEPADYEAYTYGYPPVSGRMLGSGN
jgi:hypothetical protein